MTAALQLIDDEPIEAIVERVADVAEALRGMDLHERAKVRVVARAAAETIGVYKRMSTDAERGRDALDWLVLETEKLIGEELAQLEAVSPAQGRGKARPKSPRVAAAEAVKIDRHEARRLVKLAQIPQARLAEIRQHLDTEGKRATLSTVLSAATAPSAAVGYDSDVWNTTAPFIDASVRVFGERATWDNASNAVAQALVGAKNWRSATVPTLGEAERRAGLDDKSLAELMRSWRGTGPIVNAQGEAIEPDENIIDMTKRRKAYAKAANRGRLEHKDELEGFVWLNPPYALPAPFIRAVIEGFLGRSLGEVFREYASARGSTEDFLNTHELARRVWRAEAVKRAARQRPRDARIRAAIVLVNLATSSAIQQLLFAASVKVCLLAERIGFRDAAGQEQNGNMYEQAVFYLADQAEVFDREFGHFGLMVAA